MLPMLESAKELKVFWYTPIVYTAFTALESAKELKEIEDMLEIQHPKVLVSPLESAKELKEAIGEALGNALQLSSNPQRN